MIYFGDTSAWYDLVDAGTPRHGEVAAAAVSARLLVTTTFHPARADGASGVAIVPTRGRTDCLSFVVMRRLRLTTALATDSHFFEEGFSVVP